MKTSRLRLALVLATLGAGLVPVTFAEDSAPPPPPPPHERGAGPMRFDPERRLARLTEDLKLTAEQQTALRPILAAQAEAMKALADPAVTEDQRREERRQLFQEFQSKIAKVLTPEQREAMAQMRPKRPRGDHGGPGGNRPPPPPETTE